METVYITKRGRVYHTTRNCKWLLTAHDNAERLHREVHRVTGVAPSEVGRRVPCRVCRNGGESPKRGPGKGND